jgi:hypothetical protein
MSPQEARQYAIDEGSRRALTMPPANREPAFGASSKSASSRAQKVMVDLHQCGCNDDLLISLPLASGGKTMNAKHLLNSVAIAAALAIAGPVWAQQQQPQWNPATGQPGLGAAMPSAAAPPPAATSAPATAPAPAASSATPSMHHAVRHARAMHAHHKQMAKKAALTGDTTAQLNREELARIQSGNLSNPPAPPAPPPPPAH